MVFKVSKGGVRSGNTLRGLQSRRTKLYGRHACLIGSSSLNLRDLSKLLRKSSDEDQLVEDTLRRTNVPLSLNKKQRWLVPAKINQLISSGNFHSKTMVSLLERHKLKRRANCVRFTSNSEKLPDVAPKQRKYFSYSLDTIDEEQSNREKRREKADELKKLKSQNVVFRRPQGDIKVLNAFTHRGRKIRTNVPLESSKQEYRLEVFYPCPQSCSLTFNPKYTDVVLEEGKTGDLEVKANVKKHRTQQKCRRRHFAVKDYEQFYDQTIAEDVSEMWDEFYEDDNEEVTNQEHELEDSHFQYNNNLFEMLMNQAEKARKLCVLEKFEHKRETFPIQSRNVKRPPLVYEEPRQNHISVQETPQYIQEIKALDFVKVILNSSETVESVLEQKYGALYSEASCQPRRFMIDISENVANLFSYSKSSPKNLLFVSYLVFIHDGCYDDGLDVFKVIFNAFSSKHAKSLSEYISFSETSIDDIMNNLFGCLLDLEEVKEVQSQYPQLQGDTKGAYNFFQYLHSCANLNVNTFIPSLAILEKTFSESFEEDKHKEMLRNFNINLDQDEFCDICYDIINPTKLDAVTGTRLGKCGHHCCDTCWAAHFKSSIRDGKTVITCPGYNCSNEIGLVTLLSTIGVSDVAMLFQRKAEREVEISQNSKWCPNTACGRAIKIDIHTKDFCQDIVCACGTEICFECFGSAHWPAKCDQAKEYFQKLTNMKQPKEDLEDPNVNPTSLGSEPKPKKAQVHEFEGRICPKCEKFINKNGGCNHMMCRCGFHFCWDCMKPIHIDLCVIDRKYVLSLTRLLRVHHKEQGRVESSLLSSKDRPKVGHSKQKATLYHHAFQERLDSTSSSFSSRKSLVKKIVSTAHKDLQFKQEIITALEDVPIPENEEKLKTLDIKPLVERLIKSSCEIKGLLHHVAEFSYILLQDTPHSVEKQRILRLANDISGICSFIRSILDQGKNQDALTTAIQRLMSMQKWAKRALDALIVATHKVRWA